MSKTINLDISADAATRARQSVIRQILTGLASHDLNIDQASQAIEHLIKADADDALKRSHLSNRAEA